MGWLGAVDAVVLAGGLGTRLRAVVADRPKVLAEVDGRPFLAYLLDHLLDEGVRRVVLCTGYLGDQVEAAFGPTYRGLALAYSREPEPLGTGGALRRALPLIATEQVLVVNGDSLCPTPLGPMRDSHLRRDAAATLLLSEIEDAERFGTVDLDADGRIRRFVEKATRHPERSEGSVQHDEAPTCYTGPSLRSGRQAPPAAGSLVSAGVYLLRRELIGTIPPEGPASLERELFPAWIGPNMYGYACEQRFVDIGLPSSLTQARRSALAVGSPA